MLEILLIIGAVILMAKIAAGDSRSPIAWGLITLGICAVSLLLPLPFLRILIALALSFGTMMFMNMKK